MGVSPRMWPAADCRGAGGTKSSEKETENCDLGGEARDWLGKKKKETKNGFYRNRGNEKQRVMRVEKRRTITKETKSNGGREYEKSQGRK